MSQDEPRFRYSAFGPGGERLTPDPEEDIEIPVGDTIRLMFDDDVEIPLWSDYHGLLFTEVEELVDELRVSSELAADIERWGLRSQYRRHPVAERDIEGRALVDRLNEERGHLYTFVYRPVVHEGHRRGKVPE